MTNKISEKNNYPYFLCKQILYIQGGAKVLIHSLLAYHTMLFNGKLKSYKSMMFIDICYLYFETLLVLIIITMENSRMESKRAKIIALFEVGKFSGEIFRMLKCEKVSRLLIYRAIKRYKVTGNLQERPRCYRPRTIRTRQLKMKLKKRIEWNFRRSIRKMARDFAISPRSLRRAVHEDLGLKSLKRRKVHILTKSIWEKRLQRSRDLLSRVITSVLSESCFRWKNIHNWAGIQYRKLPYLVRQRPRDFRGFSVHTQKSEANFSYGVGWNILEFPNKSNFCPSWCQNQCNIYRKLILEPEVKDACSKHFKNSIWFFQQDGAPAHTANKTQR